MIKNIEIIKMPVIDFLINEYLFDWNNPYNIAELAVYEDMGDHYEITFDTDDVEDICSTLFTNVMFIDRALTEDKIPSANKEFIETVSIACEKLMEIILEQVLTEDILINPATKYFN